MISPSSVMYVDLNVERAFLQRCRRSAIQGKMVYFPEMFKLYNMKYVYRNCTPPKTFGLNRKHGFWEYYTLYSYGMACMYKSDYSTMDQSLVGWGGEDPGHYHEEEVRSASDELDWCQVLGTLPTSSSVSW